MIINSGIIIWIEIDIINIFEQFDANWWIEGRFDLNVSVWNIENFFFVSF